MSTPAGSVLSEFVDTYHLWSLLVPLCLLGTYEVLHLASYLWFRLRGDFNEAQYSYQSRCVENRHRYEQVAGESIRALSHRAGGD
jgi:hypothetical protein